MKTTLEIPDALFRRAKATAAERGQTLKEFVGEALQERLARGGGASRSGEPEWMRGFGKLRRQPRAAIPVVVLGEFRYGIAGSRRRSAYEAWLDSRLAEFEMLPVATDA